jgi:hypothetical protein
MRIAEEYLIGIRVLGYTEAEARFLYLVATHSGYFVPRQFVNLSGAKWGYRTSHFIQKLKSRDHAAWREFYDTPGVYRLCSKEIYARIGKANLHTRRQHSGEFIQTRLKVLDFIIENQQYDYLETEDQKVAYFSETLGIPKTELPGRTYCGAPLLGPVQRYFADQSPVFLGGDDDQSGLSVAFCYVDPGEASVAGFKHHLEGYKQLLSNLAEFHFLYLSHTTMNFAAAERCFATFSSGLEVDSTADLIRYFTFRARRDQDQNAEFSKDEIQWLDRARSRFDSRDTELLHSAWRAGNVLDEDTIPTHPGATDRTRRIVFKTRLVPRVPATAGDSNKFETIG